MVLRHPGLALPVRSAAGVAVAERALVVAREDSPITLADVYRDHSPFVWRMMRRLGVPETHVEDAAQDVFLVVHRRLCDFDRRSSVRSWLAGIVRRVASDHRRSSMRKPALGRAQAETPVDDLSANHASPEDNALATEAVRLLHQLLETLDDDKREVFILAELEQWSLAEIAEATGVKLSTASSRLRLAREAFEQAADRLRARDTWRLGGASVLGGGAPGAAVGSTAKMATAATWTKTLATLVIGAALGAGAWQSDDVANSAVGWPTAAVVQAKDAVVRAWRALAASTAGDDVKSGTLLPSVDAELLHERLIAVARRPNHPVAKGAELVLIVGAEQALAARNYERAKQYLDEHEARYPRGELSAEREALRAFSDRARRATNF